MTNGEAGKTILLADDEPGILILLKTLCEGMGYRTIEASNGVKAVEMTVRLLPDLAIMDGTMPVKSGFEAIQELKSNALTDHIPIIMLTGLQTREDRLKGIAAGERLPHEARRRRGARTEGQEQPEDQGIPRFPEGSCRNPRGAGPQEDD